MRKDCVRLILSSKETIGGSNVPTKSVEVTTIDPVNNNLNVLNNVVDNTTGEGYEASPTKGFVRDSLGYLADTVGKSASYVSGETIKNAKEVNGVPLAKMIGWGSLGIAGLWGGSKLIGGIATGVSDVISRPFRKLFGSKQEESTETIVPQAPVATPTPTSPPVAAPAPRSFFKKLGDLFY